MRKILIISLALAFTASLNAQNDLQKVGWKNYTPNGFWSNWELSAGVGSGVFVKIKNPTALPFEDMLHVSFNAAISKWFNPILGGRLQIQAATGVTAELKNGKTNDFSYGYAHYDQLLNLTNWIYGYKPARLYNAVVYLGAGVAINPGKDATKELAASIGLQNRFRLCDAWNIDLELAAMVVKGYFNTGKVTTTIGGIAADINIGVGATYKFKTRDWQLSQCKEDDNCDKRVSDLEKDNDNYKKALKDANDKNSQLQKELNNARNSAKEKSSDNIPVVSPREEQVVSFTIFFNGNESTLTDEAKVHIKTISELLKKDDKNTKYIITGYADKETGNTDLNMDISKKRAEIVKKTLVNAGIDENKIKTEYKGDTVQPLGKGSINRCVIILQHK